MLIRIATRESQLAVKQASIVADALKKNNSNLEFELVKLKTKGDILLDQSLSKIGGKGLFLKELEQALIEGKADIAVHSMKDVPAKPNEELEIECILERGDDRDAFVSFNHKDFHTLPKGATIGTSSHRRKGQLLAMRPDLNIVPFRGNVDTRLRKLRNEEVDAIVLAASGLKRIEMHDNINHYFTHDEMLPAIAQGALGVQNKKNNSYIKELLKSLNHKKTQTLINIERDFLMHFNGDCSTPIAANCTLNGDIFILRSGYFIEDGTAQFYCVNECNIDNAQSLGQKSAASIKKLCQSYIA
jgi:hydroxymethylbilane synthase